MNTINTVNEPIVNPAILRYFAHLALLIPREILPRSKWSNAWNDKIKAGIPNQAPQNNKLTIEKYK
jgi:hypothetical protein